MNPLLSLPHLPVILCLGAAFVLILVGDRISTRARNIQALLIWAVVGVVLCLLQSRLPVDLVFSDWLLRLMLLGSLSYQVSLLNWAFAFVFWLAFGAELIWVSREGDAQKDPNLAPGLLAVAGATFSMLFSGNLLTLIFSWAVWLGAIFVLLVAAKGRNQAIYRLLILFGLAIFLVLWATWSVGQGDGGRWPTLTLSPSAAISVFLAAWIALGAYPFHLWIPVKEKLSPSARAILHLAPSLVGIYLLARLAMLQQTLPYADLWLAVAAIGLVVSAQLAWAHEERSASLSYTGVALAGSVVLSAVLAAPKATGLLLSWALAWPLPLLVMWLMPPRVGKKDPRWASYLSFGVLGLASASLIGLPFTAGFVAWTHLEQVALSGGYFGVIVLLLIVAARILIGGALWGALLVPAEKDHVPGLWLRSVLGAILLVPSLLGGLAPDRVIAQIAGPDWASWGGQAYSPGFLAAWLVTLVPVALGYALYLARPRMAGRAGRALEFVAGLWALDWLLHGLERAGSWLADGLDTVTDILHGEHYLVWAFLVILLFLWFYLVS